MKKDFIKTASHKYLFKILWSEISLQRRKELIVVLCLMILASFAEILSISSTIPFLSILANPDKFSNYLFVKGFSSYFLFKTSKDFILLFTVVFVTTAILAGLMRFILLRLSTGLAFAIGLDISEKIYKNVLAEDYTYHISHNSSEVLDVITTKVNSVVYNVIMPTLTFATSLILAFSILIFLIVMNPFITIASVLFFAVIYKSISLIQRRKIDENSIVIAKMSRIAIKCIQEGLGGIRDVIINSTQDFHLNIFMEAERAYRLAQKQNQIASQAPRYLVESLGMLLIALIAYIFSVISQDFTNIVPLLGALALSAQRMLPLVQNAYSGIANIRGARNTFEDVIKMMQIGQKKNTKEMKICFQDNITLKNISYSYPSSNMKIFDGINLVIKKSSSIGIVGVSGSGKSTLVDLLMGLIEPSEGELLVDGICINSDNLKSWQKNISHVPQEIYLADLTIKENIAFGLKKNEIDESRINSVIKQAQLENFINLCPQGLNTIVGDRGVQLSGGQKQRIGIARALYKGSNVIILDEATSALDSETESNFMSEMKRIGHDHTLIIVAHRLSTLKNCDFVIELDKNQVNFKEIWL
jgi:ATP-binding cassette subfamily B protein